MGFEIFFTIRILKLEFRMIFEYIRKKNFSTPSWLIYSNYEKIFS